MSCGDWGSVAGPLLACSMPDVDDRDLVLPHPVVHDIGVASEPERVHVQAGHQRTSPRQLPELHGALVDVRLDVPGCVRIPAIKIFEDGFTIREGASRVANPHMPWRLFDSATTSSGTNSPRSAWARPSRMAASVAESIGTREASAWAIERTARAIAS